MWLIRLLFCGILGVSALAGAAQGENEAAVPEVKDGKAATETEDDEVRDQFWFIGSSNYHILLRESEDQINRELNRPFGLLMPGWKRPTTFKDWNDDFLLWDLWGGYGFDLSERFSWSIYGGGGAGKIPNSHRYRPLFIPVKVSADFTRISLMTGTSISYYPFGRPQFRKGGGLLKNLAATRPVTEMNVGFNHQITIGDVTLRMPVLGKIARVKDTKQYELLWASPRAGVETPLTKATSLNVLGGYLFFHDHADEYNGLMMEFFIRHRF